MDQREVQQGMVAQVTQGQHPGRKFCNLFLDQFGFEYCF